MQIKLKRLRETAIVPTYGTAGAAAFDLYAAEDAMFDYQATVRTGWAIEVPEGHVLQIYSRSGYAAKHSARLANCVGIIDSDYRGEIMVMLQRDGPWGNSPALPILTGERVAQGIVLPVDRVAFAEADELSSTERGQGGFGSTGR